MRNLLATTLLATGVPMLNAGDELGRTQGGNNNPYCQDNEISWFDWDLADWQRDLLASTAFLTRLRAELPALRPRSFFTGREVHADGSMDLAWFAADGQPMQNGHWEDPATRTLQMLLNGTCFDHDSVLVVLHGGEAGTVRLPTLPSLAAYELLWDSTDERPGDPRHDDARRPGRDRAGVHPGLSRGAEATQRTEPAPGQALTTSPSSLVLASPACLGRIRTV